MHLTFSVDENRYPSFDIHQEHPGPLFRSTSGGSDSPGHRSTSSHANEVCFSLFLYIFSQEEAHPTEILGSDEEEQEDPKDYRKGGYHPVSIGDVFHNRYYLNCLYFIL